MIIRILALSILTEALVELFFKAAPIEGTRAWLIKITPWLNTESQGHLLNCKYCVSVWIGAGVVSLAWFADCQALRLASAALIISRLSNYAHVLIGLILDIQLNKRLERK